MSKIKHVGAELLDQYAKHIKGLLPTDRYTRFGYQISDAAIDAFILEVLYNKDKHHLFKYEDASGQILGWGHLAIEDSEHWELAVSVDSAHQGQGIGNELIAFMLTWGKTRGVHSVFMHCIHENDKIKHLARKHGLRMVERNGPEITSEIELPPPTPIDFVNEVSREQTEILNSIVRLQKQFMKNLNPLRLQDRSTETIK